MAYKNFLTRVKELAPSCKPEGIPWHWPLPCGWHLRQDIVWHKPDAMPEGARDRCTRSHKYISLLFKSERYHFDSDAFRESFTAPARSGVHRSYKPSCASSFDLKDGHLPQKGNFTGLLPQPLGPEQAGCLDSARQPLPMGAFRGVSEKSGGALRFSGKSRRWRRAGPLHGQRDYRGRRQTPGPEFYRH